MSARFDQVRRVRATMAAGRPSIGSWLQIPDGSVAEILGRAGYEWVAADLEHGAISPHQLPDLFRALELGGTLPLARIAEGSVTHCKQALDAGAGGVIVPMIESAAQLEAVRDACRWPPAGTRGVGFSRANLFGDHFDAYLAEEAQAPLLVPMIEHVRAVDNLDAILSVAGIDAVLIGPYDLSASMALAGQFTAPPFARALERVRTLCAARGIACGVHVVQPDPAMLRQRAAEGYRFLAYSLDSVFLTTASRRPDGFT